MRNAFFFTRQSFGSGMVRTGTVQRQIARWSEEAIKPVFMGLWARFRVPPGFLKRLHVTTMHNAGGPGQVRAVV